MPSKTRARQKRLETAVGYEKLEDKLHLDPIWHRRNGLPGFVPELDEPIVTIKEPHGYARADVDKKARLHSRS